MTTEPVSDDLAAMLARCTNVRTWAEQDEGPYHRDEDLERRRIVEDRTGVPLQLGVRLLRADGAPASATVEVWHCDSLGRYSGFPPPDDSAVVSADTAPVAEYLPDRTFLRGSQPTDSNGMVEFDTIFPGWYPGRTVHIHLMVHIDDTVLTSQLYFPEHVSDLVLAQPPYATRPGRDTTNHTDTIFPTGGAPAILDIETVGSGYRAGVSLTL